MPASPATDFPTKLEFLLKALSLSRGRLAADLGVSKSLVSRWVSGTNTPAPHNLIALTALIAERREGFSMLDWDRDLTALAADLGVRDVPRPATLTSQFAPFLQAQATQAVMQSSARASAACAGFWRVIQTGYDAPVGYYHQHMIMEPLPNGMTAFRVGYFDLRFTGWAYALNNQMFYCGSDHVRGNQLFGVYNLPPDECCDLMDGIALGFLNDQGGIPAALKCVLERIGVLSGDPEADTRRYEELLKRSMLATEETAPEAVRQHLVPDIPKPSRSPAGIMTPYLESIARGGDWATVLDRLPPSA